MIGFDFTYLAESEVSTWDWGQAPGWAFAYDAFPGDVVFRAGTIDFSADWSWVPILQYAAQMRRVRRDLERRREAVFEFTESELTMGFRRDENEVRISADWVEGVAVVRLQEFFDAVTDFSQRVRAEFEARFPAARENTEYMEFMGEYG